MSTESNPKKILFLYSASFYGGMLKNLSLIVDNLNRDKFTPLVATLESEKESVLLKTSDKMEYHFFPVDTVFSWSALKRIVKFMQSEGIKKLSCHGFKADFFGACCKLLNPNIRLYTIMHGWVGVSLRLRIYHLIDAFILRFFNKIIVLNSLQKKQLLKFLIARKKISIIPNGIDAEKFYESVQENHGDLKNLAQNRLVIGTCCRLGKEKNVSTIIRALSYINKDDILLIIVGTGPEISALKEQVKILNLESKVYFAGFQEDVKPYLAAFDIFVSASLKEGMPNSVLEAMASGVPVILSDILAHREMIIEDEIGLLFQTENHINLAEKIQHFFDYNTRKLFALAAHEHVAENYDLDSRIKAIENVYNL